MRFLQYAECCSIKFLRRVDAHIPNLTFVVMIFNVDGNVVRICRANTNPQRYVTFNTGLCAEMS